jgi:hypothetical protein
VVRSFGCTFPGEAAAMNGLAPDTPSQSNPINYRYLRGLVAPTSTAARAAILRPPVESAGRPTRVLAEQTAAVDQSRTGPEPRTPQPRRDASRRRGAARCNAADARFDGHTTALPTHGPLTVWRILLRLSVIEFLHPARGGSRPPGDVRFRALHRRAPKRPLCCGERHRMRIRLR